MPAAPVRRYYPGDVVGYCTVLAITEEASHYSRRLYRVRMQCCGQVVERSQKWLRDGERHSRQACPACAARARLAVYSPIRGVPLRVGETIGPVVIKALGESARYKRVRWTCCGKEEEMSHAALYRLRHDAKIGEGRLRCRACYQKARGIQAERVWQPTTEILPPGILSAASAWPRPRLGA